MKKDELTTKTPADAKPVLAAGLSTEHDLKTAKDDPEYLFFSIALPNANEETTIVGELIDNGE